MAKASFAGRTKTRLVPPLSFEEAAELNTAFLADIADNLTLAAKRADIATYVAFGPPGSTAFFEEHLRPEIGLIEASLPNFGDNLFYAARLLLDLGYGASCVLNSDSPTVPTERLVETARELERPGDRMVLGPAVDGGYYLLGLKRRHRRLFEGIAWSTEHVARQTLERAAELGLETVMLPSWYDVDDAGALRTLMRETLFGIGFSEGVRSHDARHSAAALRRLQLDACLAEEVDQAAYRRLNEAHSA
jgi:rSAM/selenodomain-associated transferase 1